MHCVSVLCIFTTVTEKKRLHKSSNYGEGRPIRNINDVSRSVLGVQPDSLVLNGCMCHYLLQLSSCLLLVARCLLRPCPHDTFPNRARSIATSSRPVARVHTGATGTLVPVSRDHLATWNERARSIAIGCAPSTLSCGRSTGC